MRPKWYCTNPDKILSDELLSSGSANEIGPHIPTQWKVEAKPNRKATESNMAQGIVTASS